MSALGWKVGDPHVERDQLKLDIPEPEPEPEQWDGDIYDMTFDEWMRSLPRTP